MNFGKKRNRKILSEKIFFEAGVILFLIIIFILVVANFRIYQKRKELISQINFYKQKIEGLQKNIETLKDDITNVNSKDYLEKVGYEKFNQARPGETVYMFVKEQKEGIKETVPFSPQKEGFFEKIGKFLLNLGVWIKAKF